MLKNCQIICFFCHNTLTNRQLTITRLSANCLDGWLMKGIVRCEEFRRQKSYALAEHRKQEYEYYVINLLGIRLTAILPIRGKHVAHDGQAPFPGWASSVPI